MLDAMFGELHALAASWFREAGDRRKITQVDPVADDAAHRAQLLEETLKRLQERAVQLTPAQFAELHKTTPQTVTRWCRDGKVSCIPNGRSYLIPQSATAPRSRANRGRRARRG